MNKKRENEHRGSSFDDFLKEEGLLEKCHKEAVKRVVAFQREKKLKNPKNTAQQRPFPLK